MEIVREVAECVLECSVYNRIFGTDNPAKAAANDTDEPLYLTYYFSIYIPVLTPMKDDTKVL